MPELEIIDKVDVPEGYRKWHIVIDNLGFDKAIKIVCPDKVTAEKQRNSILGNFRAGRLGKGDYRLCTRIFYLVDLDQFALFVWKEPKGMK